MPNTHFDPPVFEIAGVTKDVDIAITPFFYNDGGAPRYLAELPKGAVLVPTAPSDPSLEKGRAYEVPDVIAVKDDKEYGIETELGLLADSVVFEPFWATRDAAKAFGITLVEPGQAVRLECPVNKLADIEYEYGVFAGHWSPYQETGNRLLSYVITDLEHHDFPHVFASTDPEVPLVISVGRYWPKRRKLCLADLWIPRGSALYIPPKPALLGMECVDLHNNRNSARACWGHLKKDTLSTHTLLQTDGYFYWFWNAKPTVHTNLAPAP
ncbi:MAG TPA: hypothetical protein VM925_01840 [Labilithrix sp.]|nr:hypothetical protein [Labilithrix sp.]